MSTFYIYNTSNDFVLDLSGNDNISVIVFPLNKGANQKWTAIPGLGGFSYKNVQTGTYLAPVSGASQGVGLTVSADPYCWTVLPIGIQALTHFRIQTGTYAATAGGYAEKVVLQHADLIPKATTGPQIWTFKNVNDV